MKIAFVTSCLESGKDGVGDYTRLLAQECVRQGHICCLLSLNDRLITEITQSEIAGNGAMIPILRLPATLSWNARTTHAAKFISSFQVDWVSLQFVCYGFHAKGIVHNLGKYLSPLIKGRQLHIMFHELWIGQDRGAVKKERLVGSIQKIFISRLVKQLQPTLVHTSNLAYISMLQQIGISASRLPLFGSIPIAERNGNDWLFPKLHQLNLDIHSDTRTGFWLLGFFGALHSIWPPEPLFSYLYQAADRSHRKIAIISIGRLSASGEELWENLTRTYSTQFTFVKLGEKSPTKISEFLNSLDFGIATSPYRLIGKSATVAAMLEHGLPVIVNRNDVEFSLPYMEIQKENEALLCKMDDHLVDKLENLIRVIPQSRLKEIAAKLIKDLTASNTSIG